MATEIWKSNLYLSSGNRVPASIYKVEDGIVKEIFKDEKKPISGFTYKDGSLYYANWRTKKISVGSQYWGTHCYLLKFSTLMAF